MNACPCPCDLDEVSQGVNEQDATPRIRRGLFNRITIILLVGWMLIVGGAAEIATPDEKQLSSVEFIESMLR